jgi:hypothetical protein
MKVRTVVRDCLYLNWALPAAALPEAPAPLRYQLHPWRGGDHVFASALLFHQDSVRLPAVPLLRFGHPQLNLRLYVLDGEGYPSVLFLRMLMPLWMAPGVRLLTHQPAAGAHLDFPRPSRDPEAGSWCWRAERGETFSVRAWLDSPGIGEGPRLGSWEETVRYFNDRQRGYAEVGGELYRIDASHRTSAVWPMRAEVDGGRLLPKLLPAAETREISESTELPPLHSAFLCPEMPFIFSFDLLPSGAPAVRQLPHPAAGRVASPALRADALEPAERGAKAVRAFRVSSASRAARAARAMARAATGTGAGIAGGAHALGGEDPAAGELPPSREPRQASC